MKRKLYDIIVFYYFLYFFLIQNDRIYLYMGKETYIRKNFRVNKETFSWVTVTKIIFFLNKQFRLYIMVFRLDGRSFDYAHTWSKSGFSICLRHLVTSKESSNRVFLPEKTHFPSCVRNVK